jgi:Xaa-Pro aminopeptidase
MKKKKVKVTFMDKKIFIEHRQAFVNQMMDKAFALFFSGKAPHKSADQKYAYVPNRNFYYLTGLQRENFILLIAKSKEAYFDYLFIEEASDYATKWLGRRLTKEEAADISGIPVERIRTLNEYAGFLTDQILSDSRKALMGMPQFLYLDLYRDGPLGKPISLNETDILRNHFPELIIKNANESLFQLRIQKGKEERQEIEKAIAYTKKGIEAIMNMTSPGRNEHELDALFDYTIRLAGSEGVAFNSIIAGGKNATVLHYEENNQPLHDGDLVLLDLGALSGPYAGDISRTFPVNGVFSIRQRQLYELVLSVNKELIQIAKPGMMVSELNQIAKTRLAEGLIRMKLIDDPAKIEHYYYHSVSHYLGLDVHDVGTYQIPLVPGVVLTIEPGIYVEEEGIGIRIEDDIIITENGCQNLSEGIIKEVDDIQAFLSKKR